MTLQERKILGPLVRRLRIAAPDSWLDLKYQTQFGPEFSEFPYYPAALEFDLPAREAVADLDPEQKQTLVDQWKSRPRLIRLESDDAIIHQYAAVLLDALVQTARNAGARTVEW